MGLGLPPQQYPLAVQLDNSNSTLLYVGQAEPGSPTSSAVWQISRIDLSSGVVVTWANGNREFKNIWDNRSSLTYS